jgi:hypothetical protein
LEALFRSIVSLARDVDSFVESGARPIHETVTEGETLTRRVARLKHELALPENRLLSRFFTAIQLDELLDSLRDLNLAVAEQVRRTKFDLLEILVIGFYATEFAQVIVDHLHLRDMLALLSIVSVGLLFTLGSAAVLRPWKHTRSKKPSLISILVLIVSILGMIAIWYLP